MLAYERNFNWNDASNSQQNGAAGSRLQLTRPRAHILNHWLVSAERSHKYFAIHYFDELTTGV
jgi:hypothetical protein